MKNIYALETLSYSGRLVQTNGSPVVGPVTIKAELAYTNTLSNILCSEEIPNVTLTKGVFHLKLNLDCSDSGLSLTQVLSQVPNGETVAIQITDMTNSKSYNFQAMHAIPFANVASQLVQMGATDNQVIKWNNTTKRWEPGVPGGGGTVTNVSVTPPLAVINPTSTPSLSISQATSSTNGYLSSADWTTFNNKEGSISGGTSTQYYRGDKTWQTLNTDAVPEGARLYYENARVLLAPLTGLVPNAATIIATDTILQAFNKTQGQINSIQTSATHFLLKDAPDTLSGNITLSGSINSTLTGDITVNTTPLGITSAVNKSYVDTRDDLKVNKTGDTVSGVFTLDNDLKIKGQGASTNYVTIRGNAATTNFILNLPATAGTLGQFLQTDGSGNLTWTSQSTTAAPTGGAGGDLAGTYPNPTVPGLATKLSTTLANGSILVGNASSVATAVAVTGDASLSNTGVLTLANTAVTPGTFRSVTVDSKGRVTGGTNPTTLAGYGITDTLVTGVTVVAPLINVGTGVAPQIEIAQATTTVDGYLSSTDFTTFNNKQATITAATDLNAGSLTTNKQGGLVLNPFNTAAGNTGEIRFKELAANGTNYVALKSPDAITANIVFTLPSANGSAGQVLTTNASGVLSWTTVATSSTSLTGDIGGTIGANTIGAGKVTLTHLSATGTKDNTTYLRGDNTFANFAASVLSSTLTGLSTAASTVITTSDTVISSLGKLQKQISNLAISGVGGDLSGTLPNPTVAKIQGRAVTSTAPLAGQVLKYNTGTPAWEPSYVLVGDLKSSALGNLFPGTGCAANQTLYYSVIGDAFSCVDIGSLDASKITTGTIAAARLPSSATYWEAATGGINYAGGRIGIGTTTPNYALESTGDIYSATRIRVGGSGNAGIATAGNDIILRDALNNVSFRGTRSASSWSPGVDSQWFQVGNASDAVTFSTATGLAASRMKMATSSFQIAPSSGTNAPTGLFEVSNNTQGIFNVINDGHVGIGVTTPGSILTVAGAPPEATVIPQSKNSITLFGSGSSYFQGRDVTNNVEFIMGTSTATEVFSGSITAHDYTLRTQNLPRLTIQNSTGNVGIGTTIPAYSLSVFRAAANSTANIESGNNGSFVQSRYAGLTDGGVAQVWGTGLNITNGSGGYEIYDYTVGANRFYINPAGRIGMGTAAPSEKLEVIGNVKATAYLYTSDRRLKTNIETIDDSLEKILRLRGVEFDWKDSGVHEVGLIAQEVEEVEPSLVVTSKVDGMKSVKYGNLVGVLIEAMKEEHQQVQANKKMIALMNNNFEKTDRRVQKLEREIASLKDENKQLKNDIELIKKHLKLK